MPDPNDAQDDPPHGMKHIAMKPVNITAVTVAIRNAHPIGVFAHSFCFMRFLLAMKFASCLTLLL